MPCSALQVGITQKYPQVLERFRAAVGDIGYVYKSPSHPRAPFSYSAGSFENCQAVLAMLWPFLDSVKRRQARRALEIYSASPPQPYRKRVQLARDPAGRPPGTPNRGALE